MGAHIVRQPTKTLLYIAGVFLVMGVIDPHLPGNTSDPSPLALVYALVFAVLIFQWCKADAKLRGVELPTGLSVLAAFLAPIGVPVYFFFTMRFVQAVFATAKATAFLVALLGIYSLSSYISSFAL